MGAINIEAIPKSEGNMLGAMLYATITEFYKDPKNQEAFEKWMAARQQAPKRNIRRVK